MSKNERDSDQRKYDVQLYHEKFGNLGSGKLQFGGNWWTKVTFSEGLPAALSDVRLFDFVKAVVDGETTFSLCGCKVNGRALHVDYVIEADLAAAEFNSISVRYTEVSEWFLHWQNVKGTVGETLTWTQTPKMIDVIVKTEEEHFELRSEYVASRRKHGEDLVLHEHVEFIFSAKGRRFGPADLHEKTHELSCLLSILLAYPATVVSVAVSPRAGDRFHRTHFPGFERPERDMEDSSFWIRYFTQQPAIEGRWQAIFGHYYRSSFRKVCWIRLAGMQRYEGFWEYKAFGYVSLLDSYLSIRFDGEKRSAPVPPSQKKLARFRGDLAKELPVLSQTQREEITNIAARSFASDDATFGDRYRRAIAATDPDIVKIVALSEKAFSLIKKVRDRIAHGKDHGLKDGEFNAVVQTEGKIALLLTYWAFLDFGLTTKDFIKCLKTTHSRLRFSSWLDDLHLSRVSGSAEFFPVTIEKLQILQAIKGIRLFGVCIREASGELNYSEELTKIYDDWMNDPSKSTGVQNPEHIFGIDKNGARIVGEGYIECGDERLNVHQMWIIERSAIHR